MSDTKQIAQRTLVMERSTKGAYLYKDQSTAGSSPITSIYLRKDGMPHNAPATITVTITTDDDV